MKNNKRQNGFTLIELLVVIAIIAILAVVVVLTLNPAELLRQARDSNRISDFATIKSGLALYGEDVSTTSYNNGKGNNLFISGATSTNVTATYVGNATAAAWGFSATAGYVAAVTTTVRTVDGNGWLPINMNAISSGAPFGSYPADPVNSGVNFYIYAATSTSPGTWKISTKMESIKYGYNGSGDVVQYDGGNSTTTYEQGSNLQGL